MAMVFPIESEIVAVHADGLQLKHCPSVAALMSSLTNAHISPLQRRVLLTALFLVLLVFLIDHIEIDILIIAWYAFTDTSHIATNTSTCY